MQILFQAFKKGDYESAVHCYSRGLESKRDCTALWTNRAQALIKLSRFDDALIDCAAAISVCSDCLKAYVHRGRAHLGLKKFDQAETAFREVLRIDPKQQKCVKMYLKQVADARRESYRVTDEDDEPNQRRNESEETVEADDVGEEIENSDASAPHCSNIPSSARDTNCTSDDSHASEEASSSLQQQPARIVRLSNPSREPVRYSSDVTETLQMMRVPGQKHEYYLSGLKILAMELVDMTSTTVFRALEGFDLLLTEKHPILFATLRKVSHFCQGMVCVKVLFGKELGPIL